MKIWLLWAWMVGMVLSQEALPWDYSSWTPIVQNCPSCREGKKVEIRQANLQQLQFNPQPLQQQKSIFPVKTTFTPKLEQISVKPLLVQQQKSIFPAKTTINPKLKPLTFRPLTVQPQKSVVPAKTTSIPKLDKALTKDQDTAAQSTSVQAQHSGVHQQQIFDHQQRAANQKQKTNVFSVPLVHSEQVLLPVQEIDFSDKVKRDQEGSLVLGGSPNAINNNLLMTLVTSKGREADAQAKLSLLEAALTSSQPNHQQDGRLPRIFIAPSHVPPPPGYVKIALVPQADAASQPRDSLPQTFLTPNAHNLSPGFVKLNLPHSVSHLSRDIPVVVPNDQVAPNPLGLPHLNPLVSRPDASLNIQTLDEVRQAKAISSNSPTVQIVSQGEQNFHSPPQTFSRPPPPRPTTPRVRPTPSAPQTTARPPPTQITARPPPTKTTARFPPTQTTARPQPTQTSARPPPPPPPPHFSRPPPQFQQQQQRFPTTPSPFAHRPPFTAFRGAPIQGASFPGAPFPGAPFPGQQFDGPPRFIPGQPQPQPFQGQGFPQPASQFRPGQTFPAPGQPFPAPGQSFPEAPKQFPGAPNQFPGPPQQFPGAPQQFPGAPQQFPGAPQQFPGAPKQFPGSPQQIPHRFNGAPVQFGQPPSSPPQFRPEQNVFRSPNPTFRPDFPHISELTPKPLLSTTPRPAPKKQTPFTASTTPKPTPTPKPKSSPKSTPKPTTLKPIPVTSPRPVPTSTPRILSVTPSLRPTPKAFEALSPNPQIFSQGSPKPQFSSTPFINSPAPQPTPSPFPSSAFPSSQFPSSPFPPSPFPQTSKPFTLPPRPSPQPSSFTNQPTPSPVPSTTAFAPRSPVIPGFQQPERPRFPTFQQAQKARIPSFVETERPATTVETQRPRIPSVETQRPRIPSVETQRPRIPSVETQRPRIPSVESQRPRIPSVETQRPRIPSVETQRPRIPSVESQRPRIPSFQVPRRPFQPLFTEPESPVIGKSAVPEVLEAERAGFQSIETSIPALVNSEKPLIPSFQRPRIHTLKPAEVTSSPVTATREPTTATTIATTTTTEVTTPEPTSGVKSTTFKPRFRVGARRRPGILRRKPIKRIKKPITNVENVENNEQEKKSESSTLFPPFRIANRLNQLRKKEELGDAIEDPKTGVTIPPRGTFGRRIRPRTRAPNSVTSSESNPRSEPVNGRRLPSWLEQRRRQRITAKQDSSADLENDTPVDVLDSNEFSGAESIRVVVSQPAENSAVNYRDVAKTLQEKEKVLRNEQISVAVKAAEDALLHYADVVEDEAVIEKDLSAIETLTHSDQVSDVEDEYEDYVPEPEPEAAAPEPEPEAEPTFDEAVYEETTEENIFANPSAQVIEEESAYPEPKPNTEYVDQYFDYEDSLEDTIMTTLPSIDIIKHVPYFKPHLPYSTLVESSLDSHRSDIPIESSLEPEFAPLEHDDTFVAPSDSLEDLDILSESDTTTETPLDVVTEQPLLFDNEPQIIVQEPDYYYEYDDYVDSFGDDSDQAFGGSVSQVIYAVPASDWSPDQAVVSEDPSSGAAVKTLGVTTDSTGDFTVSPVASKSTPGSSEVSQGVTDQESPKFIEPPADELPVTTEVYLGEGGDIFFKNNDQEDMLMLDDTSFDDMITTIIPETTWASFSVKPITFTPPSPTSTTTSTPPKGDFNKLEKAKVEDMKWSVRGPKVLSHSTITESRTSNARVCFSDGLCFDASGIRRR